MFSSIALLPSACLGIIAKVVEAKNLQLHQSMPRLSTHGGFPVMLETTAAVHPGGSGGAVINGDGYMVGLVTSNARHGGGMVIPHLNFSIPCAALEPIFRYSRDMQESSLLHDLDKPNEDISTVWALKPPAVPPRPSPDLSKLPSFPGGDDKSSKGSRFSKFITELGDLGSGSSKLLPSKL
ncbi:hypothetical protein Leryth_026888 [Lithospermum erythrorhizon]|nr:hypothetical protein Leryth_026888 [Lithospermum erythrorhizon]